ncbi:MAG: hypothetical protein ACLP7F_06010 [Acidimicrobiales bacterium]
MAETRGNPLALLELLKGMTAAELAGGFAAPRSGAFPVSSRNNFYGVSRRCLRPPTAGLRPPREPRAIGHRRARP